MGRRAREISETCMYHIYSRGNGKQNIFESDRDCIAFLDKLYEVKVLYGIEIHAYCLMTNHFHFLMVHDDLGRISKAMQVLLSYHATRFNLVYDRSGVLFGNRFFSVPIENETHYVNLVKYIHYNPIRSKICEFPHEYPWSSYGEVIFPRERKLVDATQLIKNFQNIYGQNKEGMQWFLSKHEHSETLDSIFFEGYDLSSSERNYLLEQIESIYDGNIKQIASMENEERDAHIRKLYFDAQIKIRHIERLTGISKRIIKRICNKKV